VEGDMGYFSELELNNKENCIDRSYHGFYEQLLWRYEDLKEKYSRLSHSNAPVYGDDYFSKNDYRYSPIDCFNTLSDIYRAMEIAKEDLEEKCGIVIDDDGNAIDCSEEEEDPNQISLFEVVLLPSRLQTTVAA
jgi:hypothetical protein